MGQLCDFCFPKKYIHYHEEEECTFPRSLWQGTKNSWVETKKKGLAVGVGGQEDVSK